MEPSLSENWERLQANLDIRQMNTRGFKGIRNSTEALQKVRFKRGPIKARPRNSNNTPSGSIPQTQTVMGSSGCLTEYNAPQPTTSLLSWAEDNDISTKDLIKAYGIGSKAAVAGGSVGDKINSGLLKSVKVGRYVALDCEMVGVGGDEHRSALARVSIVNFHGIQVYDSYVRPKETVTDWRTNISGVSPSHMATARSFEEVQETVGNILKSRILVGHDVKHDLEVLMLGHPKSDIRDTSRFSGFRKYSAGNTPSLKKLAKEVLGIDIQVSEHSSIEDARIAMLLFSRHKQAFDAEHARYFARHFQHTRKTHHKPKSKKKNKKR